MTITREQVADLQPGDVVELSFPSGSAIRGTLTHEEYSSSGLGITDAHWTVRFGSGEVPPFITGCTLTVVSRAPRPLYVNHPRTEPVPGDVARDDAIDKRLPRMGLRRNSRQGGVALGAISDRGSRTAHDSPPPSPGRR